MNKKIDKELKKEIEARIRSYIQDDNIFSTDRLSSFEKGANMALYRVLAIIDNYGDE